MKTVETIYRSDVMSTLNGELGFFMQYMGESVEQLVQGKIGLRTFEQAYAISFNQAQGDSQRIDESYEKGDFGRPGIMDGGPDYISYFERDRQRCLDILGDLGISLCIS